MKRIISILLVLLLACGLCFPAVAAAEDSSEPANVTLFRAMVKNGIRGLKSEVEVGILNVSVSDARDVMQDIFNDPELFYFWSYAFWTYSNDTVSRVQIFYLDDIAQVDMTAFETEVQNALQCVQPGMDELQTALVLHDYLALHVAYDLESAANDTALTIPYTAYGALVNKKATCQGYSQAYCLLLNRCGIENLYIISDEMNHGWVILRLGGDWYHVDVTWDDPVPDTPGRVEHDYFLLSDKAISDGDHDHYGWLKDPACVNERYDAGALWEGVGSPIIFTDADTYWLLEEVGDYKDQTIRLVRCSWRSGERKTVFSVKDYWPNRAKGGNWYWLNAFSTLVHYDERLFFNDKQHVYVYNPIDGSNSKIYTYTGNEGYIYGLAKVGDSLKYVIKTDADQDGQKLYDVVFPAEYSPLPFRDVARSDYFFNAVRWAYEQNVTAGTDVGLFSPGRRVSRAEAVTFLWRANGCPEPQIVENPFVDVADNAASSWYYKAVLWALEEGITAGTSATTFSPHKNVSRAEAVTFLWVSQNCPVSQITQSPFQDADDSTIWYYKPMLWALDEGITAGTSSTTFSPLREVTRGEIITFLYRAQE